MADASDDVTAADEGAPVIDEDGLQIGVLARVEGGDAHVDVDADLTDDARATLAWGETRGDRRVVPRSALERVDPRDLAETEEASETEAASVDDATADAGEGEASGGAAVRLDLDAL